jgi:hypothetical protein
LALQPGVGFGLPHNWSPFFSFPYLLPPSFNLHFFSDLLYPASLFSQAKVAQRKRINFSTLLLLDIAALQIWKYVSLSEPQSVFGQNTLFSTCVHSHCCFLRSQRAVT